MGPWRTTASKPPAATSTKRASAERALQFDQPLADHRFGQPEPPGGFADGPCLSDCHEGGDAVELHCSTIPETIFGGSRLFRTMHRFYLSVETGRLSAPAPRRMI